MHRELLVFIPPISTIPWTKGCHRRYNNTVWSQHNIQTDGHIHYTWADVPFLPLLEMATGPMASRDPRNPSDRHLCGAGVPPPDRFRFCPCPAARPREGQSDWAVALSFSHLQNGESTARWPLSFLKYPWCKWQEGWQCLHIALYFFGGGAGGVALSSCPFDTLEDTKEITLVIWTGDMFHCRGQMACFPRNKLMERE